MDRQEVFNKVATHLLTQKSKAQKLVDDEFRAACYYLMEDGRKCAVGCLLPDGHPGQKLMGTVSNLLWQYPDLAYLWEVDELNNDVWFLTRLQEIHDSVDVENWHYQLTQFARDQKLEMVEVN